MDLALFILRVVTGLLLAGHGSQKLFGWFKGQGLDGFTGWLASMGFRPARTWARIAGICEFGGGLLFALGLFSPLGSLLIAASMITAIAKVHWPKIWVTEGGIELPLTNLAIVIAVGIAGPGAISLDAMSGTTLPGWLATLGIIAVLIGWAIAMTTSAMRPQQGTAPSTR
ncbi:MAG TPA: DoxX family protein [bacterium]|nr:DoxX family protein [bacterium]